MNNFYVCIFRPSRSAFYVGKGNRSRYYICAHLQVKAPNSFLKNKIKKVGIKNVKIEFPLKNVSEADAFGYEELFIGIVGRRDQGKGPLCNLTDGGEGESGRIVSVEHRQKISEALEGHEVSEKSRQKISKTLEGYKHSKETKRKISEALKDNVPWITGKKHSEETKQKISGALKGHRLSRETKQKISKANKGNTPWMTGRNHSKETKRKMSKTHKGKKLSKEHRRKLSEAHRGHRPSEETKRKMRDAWRRRKNYITNNQMPGVKRNE